MERKFWWKWLLIRKLSRKFGKGGKNKWKENFDEKNKIKKIACANCF